MFHKCWFLCLIEVTTSFVLFNSRFDTTFSCVYVYFATLTRNPINSGMWKWLYFIIDASDHLLKFFRILGDSHDFTFLEQRISKYWQKNKKIKELWIPFYLVRTQNKDIIKINRLYSLRWSRAKNKIQQTWTMPSLSAKCKFPSRCVECSGPNDTYKCMLVNDGKSSNAKWALCREKGHPANCKGCSEFKFVIRKSKPNRNTPPKQEIIRLLKRRKQQT